MMIGFGAKTRFVRFPAKKRSRNRKILRLIWMVVAVGLDFFFVGREEWKET